MSGLIAGSVLRSRDFAYHTRRTAQAVAAIAGGSGF